MARRGICSRLIAVSAAVLVTLAVSPVAAHAGPDDAGQGHELRWSQLLQGHPGLMEDHLEAQAQLGAAERRAADTSSDLDWISNTLSESEALLVVLTEERDRASARRELAGERLERARRSFEVSRLRMDAHASTIYKHGAPALGPIESLLRSDSPGDFVVRHRMFEAVLLEDDASVRRAGSAVEHAGDLYGRAVVQASVAHTAWESEHGVTEQLRELAVMQARQVGATQRAVGPRARALERARSAESANTATMTALEELIGADDPDRRSALRRRRAAEHADAAKTLAAAYPYLGRAHRARPETMPPVAGYRCPVEDGRFVNDWAFPRPGGRSHEGTDVFADRGASVLAVTEGTVVGVDRHDAHGSGEVSGDLGGRTVTIETPWGERWYFAHLDTVAEGIELDGAVTGGQTLGTVGDSGNARGGTPHLHLGRTWHGVPVNPHPSLWLACAP